MASGLLPKSPVSSSLCDEVPHIFIPKSHLEPREFLISSAKRLLQQYLPIADIHATPARSVRAVSGNLSPQALSNNRSISVCLRLPRDRHYFVAMPENGL